MARPEEKRARLAVAALAGLMLVSDPRDHDPGPPALGGPGAPVPFHS